MATNKSVVLHDWSGHDLTGYAVCHHYPCVCSAVCHDYPMYFLPCVICKCHDYPYVYYAVCLM